MALSYASTPCVFQMKNYIALWYVFCSPTPATNWEAAGNVKAMPVPSLMYWTLIKWERNHFHWVFPQHLLLDHMYSTGHLFSASPVWSESLVHASRMMNEWLNHVYSTPIYWLSPFIFRRSLEVTSCSRWFTLSLKVSNEDRMTLVDNYLCFSPIACIWRKDDYLIIKSRNRLPSIAEH